MSSAVGPVECLIVVFEGNQFKGEIISALNDLLDKRLIRVIDLAVISKDQNGNVTILSSDKLLADGADVHAKPDGTGIFSEDVLIMAAEELENNSTGAAMLFENIWAAHFAQAIRNANGQVLLNVRIPNDVLERELAASLDVA